MSISNILVIDDSLTFLDTITRFLYGQPEITNISTADHRQAAQAAAKNEQPDVILLDLNMPGFNGLELISDLRQLAPQAHIIVLTVLDTNVYRQAALAAGADAFIPKARLYVDLLPAIRRLGNDMG